jgi:outer membrane protein OmpA-like peptidoglycan-associated protein
MRPLPIASQCHASWDEMHGDERSRHCDACERRVFDLSARTEVEARAVLALLGNSGFCVRYELDARGSMAHRVSPARSFAAAALAAAVTTGCGGAATDTRAAPPERCIVVPSLPAETLPPNAAAAPSPSADLDSDADGIVDALDACPREPGPSDNDPKKNGCPHMGIVVTHQIQILERIAFTVGQSRVLSESNKILQAIARVLLEHPELTKVEVAGHASSREPNADKLAVARAEAVAAFLVARGVDAKRLVVEGYGAERPLAPNDTEADRQQNRRVEFRVLEASR